MAIFKCKMCGGALEVAPGTLVAKCEYCETTQTLPRLENDKRANTYDRANHFRRNNEFDKAMALYEGLLNEDSSDSEAYWSIVLCRYGIEYVEDPATHRRVPTVNRAQFTSILLDDDYRAALRYADPSQKSIYEAEARAIDEIQKGILLISQKEDPFDIFICYKETDANGRRTLDSVLAQDLYYGLKNEGFKVFFARITLEDKLGSAYEPYIFAALNSAKVMVVVGTSSENFNAVWVKNEWSRYLSLIKQGKKKTIIPAYKDMDPYDLPQEFAHLQAQDMSKLGFMQDLVRGIKKIAGFNDRMGASDSDPVMILNNSDIAPLIRRIFIFLDDENWESADEYAEKVLDHVPEHPEVYLAKLMVDLKVRKRHELELCATSFEENINYKKAYKYGDADLKSELDGYLEKINARQFEARYLKAIEIMNNARSKEDVRAASKIFASLNGYKDSDELKEKCLEREEIVHKDELLNKAISKMAEDTVEAYADAIAMLSVLKGWKNADEQKRICEEKSVLLLQNGDEKKRQKLFLLLAVAGVIGAVILAAIVIGAFFG